jgi:5-(carboxyamino)imidazole ribonucleotide synthase
MIVGIIGGGQLARMLALAGYPLGLRFVVLDPAPDACAGQVSELIQSPYDEPTGLAQLAEQTELVTFDFENVPVTAARWLQQRVTVLPSPMALETAQDRLLEKRLFRDLGIPTPPFAKVNNLDELQTAVVELGLQAVLKTRRLGYDGKGQRVLKTPADILPAWKALSGVPLILESFVPFERELSILALRNRQGQTAFYPLVENRHRDGILRLSIAPYADERLQDKAQHYAVSILQRLDYVGLLAIEFFVQEGQLVANEMAPRVHNSGHWSIEGAEVSQFENHLRAILGLPLGSTQSIGYSAMLNCIGELPRQAAVLAMFNAHFHDYGKIPRPGRKVGHITLRADSRDSLETGLVQLMPLVGL